MKKEYIFAAGAVVIWGTLTPVSKLLFNNALPEMELLFLSSAAASAALLLITAFSGNLKHFKEYTPADLLALILFGFIGIFLYTAFYNFGIAVLSSQEACIINYLWPVTTVIFCCIILKERFTLRKLAAAAISFSGIVVIATRGDFSSLDLSNLKGVFACFAAALCYGLFSALNKKKSSNQFCAMTIYYIVSTAASGLVLLFTGEFIPVESAFTAAGIIWIGVFANAAGYLLWCLALVGGDTAKISNIAFFTPFLTIVSARIILGEEINIFAFIGLLMILFGVFIQTVKIKREY
ncbi:MAG: DMT family transporter [Clostridiales bacterium]|nr:DMT family transporter [Clostridiales bacterium]